MDKGKDTSIAKHLIVISYDAFSEDNWELASNQPNLSRLIHEGAYTTQLKSVYPTLTYTVHTTMVTGVYPDRHGIFHNNPFEPFVPDKEKSWFWFRKDINAPTIYEAAKKYKMSTAAFLWPVSGKAGIRYNIPEIRAIKKENQALKVLKNGSPFFCVNMERKYGHIRHGIEQPYLDDFTTLCAIDTIKRKKPNLLMMHLIDLDDAKHVYGTNCPQVSEVIKRMDQRLGHIIKATEDAGMIEDTVFIIVGDHGQLDVRYKVHLNNLLRDHGLIFEENGKMKWRAYFQCAGGSAYLHMKEGDTEAERIALAIMKESLNETNYGIESIYTKEELKQLHVGKLAKYMLEAKKGYEFDESIGNITIVDLKEEGITYATHGYSPDKPNYHCNLIISGSRIKKEYPMGAIDMIDLAPTMANILGIPFDACDGSPIKRVLVNEASPLATE